MGEGQGGVGAMETREETAAGGGWGSAEETRERAMTPQRSYAGVLAPPLPGS